MRTRSENAQESHFKIKIHMTVSSAFVKGIVSTRFLGGVLKLGALQLCQTGVGARWQAAQGTASAEKSNIKRAGNLGLEYLLNLWRCWSVLMRHSCPWMSYFWPLSLHYLFPLSLYCCVFTQWLLFMGSRDVCTYLYIHKIGGRGQLRCKKIKNP